MFTVQHRRKEQPAWVYVTFTMTVKQQTPQVKSHHDEHSHRGCHVTHLTLHAGGSPGKARLALTCWVRYFTVNVLSE